MLATFGPVTFEVLAVRGLELQDQWSYAEHAVIEGKPRLQFTGQGLREGTITVRLRREWGDPEALLASLRTLAAAAEAHPLQRSDGTLLGTFVVVALSETPRWTLADGRPVQIEARLSLKEYIEDDAAPAPAPARVPGSPLARSSAADETRPGGAKEDVPGDEIVRR